MVGLLDIVPAKTLVNIQGTPVEVTGVSVKGVASLLARFPELRSLLSGQEIGADKLMHIGGDIVAAIIAAGTGYPGDEKAEAVAVSLPLNDQAELVSAIIPLTMPEGLGPFVERLGKLGLALNTASTDGKQNAPQT